MTVRAKFSVQKIECSHMAKYMDRVDGVDKYATVEMRTIHMNPVYSSDPNHENRKFWDASPSGGLTLGTVNPGAWEQFELGNEYYLDFSPAAKQGSI